MISNANMKNPTPARIGASDKFNHPFEPYDIQLELMNRIYDTLEGNFKVGLFESPTGTGKTLSLICSTMTWSRQYKKLHVGKPEYGNDSGDESGSDSEPEWVKTAYTQSVLPKYKQKLKDYEQHLEEAAHEYDNHLNKVIQLPSQKKLKVAYQEDFMPDDYHSDSETPDKNEELKEEINKLLSDINGTSDQFNDLNSIGEFPRVIFSSRTHSQLNQFTSQLNMTSFESSLDDITERTKYLPLGSRKQLCIHPKVSKLSNTESINDACKELNKQEKSSRCEFLSNSRNQEMKAQFNDYSMTKIHDIEDLSSLGKHLKVCPYYSVRDTIKLAEIISMPYQMLLEDSTRDVLSLDLQDSVVIIDEAHNLLDVINSLNSVSISLNELNTLVKTLKFYSGKFLKKLNSGNRINLMKLTKICQILSDFIAAKTNDQSVKSGQSIQIEQIFQGNTGDLFNIHKLNNYLSKSKIAFKIENYIQKIQQDQPNPDSPTISSSTPLMFKLTKFLKCLSHPSKEGKFFWNLNPKDNPSISYMLLDPSEIFKPIVDKCKCLILCGGTMEPMSDYTEYLFPYLESSLINKFSCDHIIPNSNLKTIPITSFNSQPLEFSFKNRNSVMLMNNLGHCLIRLLKTVPKGTVIFFPSYKYLNQIVAHWKSTEIYSELIKVKSAIFIEPNNSNEVEGVLSDYSQAIKSSQSALLFSVVGGKLSEGINFSDDLARAVIMIGLPYPNLMSGELIAKKNFIESTTISKTGSRELAAQNSRQYIENICMRAINQSIGRSIRHANDYSMIYLIDDRYKQKSIQDKLSGWIKRRIVNDLSFNQIIDHTNEFFMSKSIQKLS